MKINIAQAENGEINKTMGHNNRAPGLLRIFVEDKRVDAAKDLKMVAIKKDANLQGLASQVLDKPIASLIFRFNKNLGNGKVGILVQDGTQKFQPANAAEISITVESDEPAQVDTPAPAPVPEPAAEPANEAEPANG